jgi:hypothetical protein
VGGDGDEKIKRALGRNQRTPCTGSGSHSPFSNTVSWWPTCAELPLWHSWLPIVPDRRAEI